MGMNQYSTEGESKEMRQNKKKLCQLGTRGGRGHSKEYFYF